MPTENWFGLVGSLLLLFAPARDQLLRIIAAYYALSDRKYEGTKEYWTLIQEGFEQKRNAWNFWDSCTMTLGAICLALSYVVGT